MKYRFKQPIQAIKIEANGDEVLIGYGIGDQIEVQDLSDEEWRKHPMSCMLTECSFRHLPLPLTDGSTLDFQANYSVLEMVYPTDEEVLAERARRRV